MTITLNGKSITVTSPISLFGLKQQYRPEAEIMIVNGYQLHEDRLIQPDDTIHFIQKGILPPKDELESMLAARHTPQIYQLLKQSKVAIAGLGGLGSQIAMMLARTGVGHLFLVDFDIVEPSNLNRQCYAISHLGMYKTQALKSQIEQVNPFVCVTCENTYVTSENLKTLFQGYQVVCEAFDNPVCKAELVGGILEHFPDCDIVAASGMAGYESSNLIRTKRIFGNLYLCGDNVHEAKPGQGLMAPRVSICAAHQANMVIRLLLGEQEA